MKAVNDRRAEILLRFTWWWEIACLTAIVASSSIIMLGFYIQTGAPLIQCTILCFFITLIASHLYAMATIGLHTEKLKSYIDYVYLSIAVIGVVFTAMDQMQKEYNEKVNHFIRSDTLDLENEIMGFAKTFTVKFCTADREIGVNEALDDWCMDGSENIPDRITQITIAYQNFTSSVDFYDGLLLKNAFAYYIRARESKGGGYSALVTMQMWRSWINNLYKLQDGPFGRPRTFLNTIAAFGQLHSIALFLIAAAVALRITKVSVELGKWY